MWPHSIRYGREVGTTMLIFIMAMAYAATSPLILPFALAYFIVTWSVPSPSHCCPCSLPTPLSQAFAGHNELSYVRASPDSSGCTDQYSRSEDVVGSPASLLPGRPVMQVLQLRFCLSSGLSIRA